METTYTIDGITDVCYMADMPDELIRTLRLAEKAGLFADFRCGTCEAPNALNWRDEKIKVDGLHYTCEDCGTPDIVGMDIIKESAATICRECFDEIPEGRTDGACSGDCATTYYEKH